MTEEEIHKIILKFRPKKMLPENVEGMRFVCNYLCEKGKTNVKELCDVLSVSSARMAVIINKLEEKKYVRRIKGVKDKRVTYVELTLEGINAIQDVKVQTIKIFNMIKEKLGEDEFERFMHDLDKISEIRMEDIKC